MALPTRLRSVQRAHRTTGSLPRALLVLVASVAMLALGPGCTDPCDEADCDTCTESCVVRGGNAQCTPNGRVRCEPGNYYDVHPDMVGACVPDDADCATPGSCDECSESTNADGTCRQTNRRICPNGECVSVWLTCATGDDCTDDFGNWLCACDEHCANGECQKNWDADYLEVCADGTCVHENDPSMCPPNGCDQPCDPCTQVCFEDGYCIDESFPHQKRCDDGRCIPADDCCVVGADGECTDADTEF